MNETPDPCGVICDAVFGWTSNARLAEAVDGLAQAGFTLVLVFVLAVLARAFLRRLVGASVERAKAGTRPGALARLADKVDGEHDQPLITERRVRRAESMGALIGSIGAAVIWSIAITMGLSAIGVDIGPLIAGAGIVGIALGFGAQDLVKDFLSGVFMLVEDQYGVGDVIDVGVGEAAGVVEGVSLRTTRIRDVQGRLWHVPNGEIRRVANSSQAWAKALLDVDVAYDSDVDDAIRAIEEVGRRLNADEDWTHFILEDPEVLGVQNLAADSIQLRVVIKTVAGEQFKVGRELRRRIKYAMDAEGIEIPFQQRTVWIRQDDAAKTPAARKAAKKATQKSATQKRTAKAKSRKTPQSTKAGGAEGEVS